MSDLVQLNSIISIAPGQVAADLAHEVVILDSKSGRYFSLSAVGARIWQLIQTPCTVAQILDTLLAEYEVEAERCETDLLALLGKMQERGLIEVAADTE